MYEVEVYLTCDMCKSYDWHKGTRKNDCMGKDSYRRWLKETKGWKTVEVDGKTYDICRLCAEHYGRDIKDELRRRNK